MAATRVSLSMDDSVLARARHHSKVRKVSISKLFVTAAQGFFQIGTGAE